MSQSKVDVANGNQLSTSDEAVVHDSRISNGTVAHDSKATDWTAVHGSRTPDKTNLPYKATAVKRDIQAINQYIVRCQ